MFDNHLTLTCPWNRESDQNVTVRVHALHEAATATEFEGQKHLKLGTTQGWFVYSVMIIGSLTSNIIQATATSPFLCQETRMTVLRNLESPPHLAR